MTTRRVTLIPIGGTISSASDVQGLLRPSADNIRYYVSVDSTKLSDADIRKLALFATEHDIPFMITRDAGHFITDVQKIDSGKTNPMLDSKRLRIAQKRLAKAAEAARNETGIVGEVARSILEELRSWTS